MPHTCTLQQSSLGCNLNLITPYSVHIHSLGRWPTYRRLREIDGRPPVCQVRIYRAVEMLLPVPAAPCVILVRRREISIPCPPCKSPPLEMHACRFHIDVVIRKMPSPPLKMHTCRCHIDVIIR